jgi:hypothetical protein
MSNNNAHMPHMLLKNTCAIMICWFDTYHRSKEAHVNTMAVAIPWLIFSKASKGLERNDVGRCFKECFREISLQFRFFKEMEFGMISHLVEHGRSMLLLNKKKSRDIETQFDIVWISCAYRAPQKKKRLNAINHVYRISNLAPQFASRGAVSRGASWIQRIANRIFGESPSASNRFQSLDISNHFENQTSQKCQPLTKENTNTKDTMSKIVTMNSEVEGRNKMYWCTLCDVCRNV